ncbi:hypothetical protein SKAU_G00044830 [Synaphobranchus kaupii]|uniref:Uncharacterized protein n=1 Tax=Synaphobranchus kaupii TaxID=118154 RepID=A0A9Q1G2P0_SYNKA|nr:hypothetical protein SKAU_G00044830 [Synaphobranchus kaupii]
MTEVLPHYFSQPRGKVLYRGPTDQDIAGSLAMIEVGTGNDLLDRTSATDAVMMAFLRCISSSCFVCRESGGIHFVMLRDRHITAEEVAVKVCSTDLIAEEYQMFHKFCPLLQEDIYEPLRI